jgi:D-amino peptidase
MPHGPAFAVKKTSKVYLHTDIEGVAGYVHYYSMSASLWNFHHVQRMNRLLTGEINAAALACKESGVKEVWVNDSHGPCYNILFEELDPICRILHGRPGHAPSWLPGLDESFDAAIAIGMHPKAGTPNAVCNHSLWHLTDALGITHRFSETVMAALLCATRKVPLVAVSGDQHICREISEWIPGCRTAEVKTSLGIQFANSLHPLALPNPYARASLRSGQFRCRKSQAPSGSMSVIEIPTRKNCPPIYAVTRFGN